MSEIHHDRPSYEVIWQNVIQKEISNYQSYYANCIELIPNLKEEIWQKYVSLNSYCRQNYMMQTVEKLDRHKVAACYMIAIATLKPMRFVKKIDGKDVSLAINETLAITVGLSIVRAYAIAAIKKDFGETSEAEELTAKFEAGIKMPDGDLINHGDYLNNYANELNFAITEGKICVLSIAHELYLLEVITKII